jgi:hypothetical protein
MTEDEFWVWYERFWEEVSEALCANVSVRTALMTRPLATMRSPSAVQRA